MMIFLSAGVFICLVGETLTYLLITSSGMLLTPDLDRKVRWLVNRLVERASRLFLTRLASQPVPV